MQHVIAMLALAICASSSLAADAAAGGSAAPIAPAEAAMRHGYSARWLIGAEASGRGGESLGKVTDLLIAPDGRVSGVLVGTLPIAAAWRQVTIAAGEPHVTVFAGPPGRPADLVPEREMRATALLGDAFALKSGERYGTVRDLVVSRTGEVAAVVVEEAAGDRNGLRALAWRGARLDPSVDTHILPYDRSQLSRLRPFEHGELGILR